MVRQTQGRHIKAVRVIPKHDRLDYHTNTVLPLPCKAPNKYIKMQHPFHNQVHVYWECDPERALYRHSRWLQNHRAFWQSFQLAPRRLEAWSKFLMMLHILVGRQNSNRGWEGRSDQGRGERHHFPKFENTVAQGWKAQSLSVRQMLLMREDERGRLK